MPLTRIPSTSAFACYHLAAADQAPLVFYSKLFGWTTRELRPADAMGDTTFRSGDVDVATASADASEGRWLPFLGVADVESAALEAERHGGAVQRASPDADGALVVIDPSGAGIGLRAGRPGSGAATEAAAPGRICWTELMTSDPDAAARFYEALAGWTAVERHRGQEGRYWMFRCGGRDVAGMRQPAEATGPSCWLPYIQVVSPEETATLAHELGGEIVMAPGDVPGRGRFAVLRDPGGALLAVFALTEAA